LVTMQCESLVLMPMSFDIWEGDEAKDQTFSNTSLLKVGDLSSRPRFDTATTMAPSPSISFTGSPCMTPRGIDAADFTSNFMLDDTTGVEKVMDEKLEESMDDPVSRVNSPAHKVARLEVPGLHINIVAPAISFALTPRASEKSVPESPSTPRTPRPSAAVRSSTPPPLVPKTRKQKPLLLQMLQKNNYEEVRSALQQNPESANEPFWEHDCEPPLCAAVRLKCSSSIVKLLLEHGAESDSKDVHCRTPAQLLPEMLPYKTSSPVNNVLPWGRMPACAAAPAPWVLSTPFQAHFHPSSMPQAFGGSARFNAQESWRLEVMELLEPVTDA